MVEENQYSVDAIQMYFCNKKGQNESKKEFQNVNLLSFCLSFANFQY